VDVGDVFIEGALVLEDSGAGAFWPATCGETIPRLQQRGFVDREMVSSCLLARENTVTARTACPFITNHSLGIGGNEVFGSGSDS
jgi:hypothetical protein